jgi:nitrogen fixation/metabolism regulation signal transduction histidine kinase
VLVIEDLSELLSAQRAAAWSEVARRMAHESRNPLTPIQLSAERIAKNYKRVARNGGSNGNGLPQDAMMKSGLVLLLQSAPKRLARGCRLKAMVDEFSSLRRLPAIRLEATT